jgi:hypothetical protein
MNLRRIPLPVVGVLAAATVVVVLAAVALAPAVRPAPVAVLPSTSATAPPTATPVPTPTAVLALRPDGMATVAVAGGLQVWSAPGGAKAKALEPTLALGAVVYLVSGPRRAGTIDWWEIQPDFVPRAGAPFGWIHASDADGRPSLIPFAPECPSSDGPIDQSRLVAIGSLRSLACFGGRDIAVRGDLACYDAAVDWAVGGASWMGPNYTCSLNQSFYVEGPAVANLQGGRRPLTGFYEIRGHFDDPESAACSWIPFGTFTQAPSGHPDPGAVMACRRSFVVTAATKLP